MPATTPTKAMLADARWVNLVRRPETNAALSLTDAVWTLALPHMGGKRAIGPKSLPSFRADLGTVLAGVMRPGLQGVPVRAQARPGGAMWEDARPGRDRFWRIADALQAARLLGKLDGIRTPEIGFDGHGGYPAALWPTPALLALAAAHGVIVDRRKDDWRTDPNAPATPRKPGKERDAGLVTCKPVGGLPLGLTPAMQEELEAMRRELQALNDANGAAVILGAGHTSAAKRRFRHSPAFGGRFYLPLANISPNDRKRVTINGEAVAEVDVRASQLTVLLGLTGHAQAPADAYEVPGIPRGVVKAWCVQALGAGRPAGQWAGKNVEAMRGHKVRAVGDAMLAQYPFFADLAALVRIPMMPPGYSNPNPRTVPI